jgi:hypothetical protein
MIESQCNYVLDALRLMEASGAAELEGRPEAQAAYNARVQEQMHAPAGPRTTSCARRGLRASPSPPDVQPRIAVVTLM